MRVEALPIGDIVPYAHNAKEHPQWQIDQIAASIDEFGNNDPIAIDEGNVVIEGHGRLLALKQLGYQTAECIRLSHLSDEQKRAYILAHNKLTMNTGFDEEELAAELARITEIDMSELGFDDVPQGEVTAAEVFEDEPPEPPAQPRTKRGDLYVMGAHRLLCGDSTDPADVERLMGGAKADLLLTDPPYNIAYEGKTADKLTIDNDAWTDDAAFVGFLGSAFSAALAAMRPGAAFYIWHASTQMHNFRRAADDAGMEVHEVLVWNKSVFTLGRQDYQWKHEPCLYGWKGGAAHYFTDDRTLSTVIETANMSDPAQMTKRQLVAFAREALGACGATTVIDCKKPARSEMHPTMKPVQLFAHLMENSTRPGESVLDLFGGSGTTAIAAEQMGRRAYLMELDPAYCDAIVDRWEQLTGERAVLAEG